LINAIRTNNLQNVKNAVYGGANPAYVYKKDGVWGAYESDTALNHVF